MRIFCPPYIKVKAHFIFKLFKSFSVGRFYVSNSTNLEYLTLRDTLTGETGYHYTHILQISNIITFCLYKGLILERA